MKRIQESARSLTMRRLRISTFNCLKKSTWTWEKDLRSGHRIRQSVDWKLLESSSFSTLRSRPCRTIRTSYTTTVMSIRLHSPLKKTKPRKNTSKLLDKECSWSKTVTRTPRRHRGKRRRATDKPWFWTKAMSSMSWITGGMRETGRRFRNSKSIKRKSSRVYRRCVRRPTRNTWRWLSSKTSLSKLKSIWTTSKWCMWSTLSSTSKSLSLTRRASTSRIPKRN